MRTTLSLPNVQPLTMPDLDRPPCSAVCPDTPVQWEHPCTFRARWIRDGIPLCGVHVARLNVTVEVPEEVTSLLVYRRRNAS